MMDSTESRESWEATLATCLTAFRQRSWYDLCVEGLIQNPSCTCGCELTLEDDLYFKHLIVAKHEEKFVA